MEEHIKHEDIFIILYLYPHGRMESYTYTSKKDFLTGLLRDLTNPSFTPSIYVYVRENNHIRCGLVTIEKPTTVTFKIGSEVIGTL